jgi:hypothetical protein
MRGTAGFTQRDLGKKLKKPQSWVYNCESANRRIDVTEFIIWCRACGIERLNGTALNFLATAATPGTVFIHASHRSHRPWRHHLPRSQSRRRQASTISLTKGSRGLPTLSVPDPASGAHEGAGVLRDVHPDALKSS